MVGVNFKFSMNSIFDSIKSIFNCSSCYYCQQEVYKLLV